MFWKVPWSSITGAEFQKIYMKTAERIQVNISKWKDLGILNSWRVQNLSDVLLFDKKNAHDVYL